MLRAVVNNGAWHRYSPIIARMGKLRLGGFGATLVLTVVLLASDWPVGFWQDFWVEHPLWAAVVGGFLLLLMTAYGVDAYVRRREAGRWRVIGRVAAGEFHFGCARRG